MDELILLNLANNALSGLIPTELSRLGKLETLSHEEEKNTAWVEGSIIPIKKTTKVGGGLRWLNVLVILVFLFLYLGSLQFSHRSHF